MTEKLYWSDPHATSFEAALIGLRSHGGRPSLILRKTLFYPEGGGQLGDTGTLALGTQLLRVADTQIEANGTIHHVLADSPPPEISAMLTDNGLVGRYSIRGAVDSSRRRDHMAQHTAQHALSRALADEAKAETVSSRLGATACTIDVSRSQIPDAELHRAEDVVNALSASDVVVRAFFPTERELSSLPLRKVPSVKELVRVIDIQGFDMTPCGGTHCSRTAQFGQVRIIGIEKNKGGLRITFHAGTRALADARASHQALATIAAELTCGLTDVPAAVAKLRAEAKIARSQLEAARTELIELVARAAREALPSITDRPTPIVLPFLRSGDDVSSLRLLAGKVTEDARVVALAASIDPSSGELVLVIQRGKDAKLDCGAFVLAQAKARSGRGGGRPERAEGRFPRGTSLEVLAAAVEDALPVT